MGACVSMHCPLVLFQCSHGLVRSTGLGRIWKHILLTGKGKNHRCLLNAIIFRLNYCKMTQARHCNLQAFSAKKYKYQHYCHQVVWNLIKTVRSLVRKSCFQWLNNHMNNNKKKNPSLNPYCSQNMCYSSQISNCISSLDLRFPCLSTWRCLLCSYVWLGSTAWPAGRCVKLILLL